MCMSDCEKMKDRLPTAFMVSAIFVVSLAMFLSLRREVCMHCSGELNFLDYNILI